MFVACLAACQMGPSHKSTTITANDITTGVQVTLKMYIKLLQSATIHGDMPFLSANLWHKCAVSASFRLVIECNKAESLVTLIGFDGAIQ
jgi:hypothetical protein